MYVAHACALLFCAQHIAAGGRLDMTLLQGLIGHAWAHDPHRDRYDDMADREDATYQVGAGSFTLDVFNHIAWRKPCST